MTPVTHLRRFAWVAILVVDLAYIAWGGGIAVAPEQLLGPGGKGILPAGYEGYSGLSWSDLVNASPQIAGYMKVLFRMYGVYCVLFGLMSSVIAMTAFRRGERWAWWTLLAGNSVALLSAMTYDWIVNAIGPFEVSEYFGLVLVWAALAVTARSRSGSDRHAIKRPGPSAASAPSRSGLLCTE